MKNREWMQCLLGLFVMFCINPAFADSDIYCPQNHAYISVGMSQAEVFSACGKPTHIEKSQVPFSRKVPMMQLMYNNQGSPKAFYGVWSLQVGVNTGSTVQIDIVDNKVYGVHVNGEGGNAFSICDGASIVKGDPVSKIYTACGNPSNINNTYITIPYAQTTFPQIWVYDIPYQGTMRLTFVNGKLESMD